MSQNLLSLTLNDETLTTIDQALSSLEAALVGLISLTADQRRGLARMGDKSEAFCRQTLNVLAQNPQVLPPSFNLAEAKNDLAAVDALRPRLARMQRLFERIDDSTTALGSDVMTASLEGYAPLKVSGRNQGLEGLREALSARFGSRRPAQAPADAPAA